MIKKFNVPRVLITATGSGGGKTTVTCGILKALKNKGLEVDSFKCGPDYIDPMFHSKILEIPSRNLDLFFSSENVVKYILEKNTVSADIVLMEGVMGYYDGIGAITSDAGAYDLSVKTKTPSVLIIDCKGKSVSILAEIKGFVTYKENSNIKAVILNRISPMLYPMIKDEIEKQLGIKVLGYLPYMGNCSLESRHLGLITAEEIGNLEEIIDELGKQVSESVDLDYLIELASSAPELSFDNEEIKVEKVNGKPKIAVARDEAFCFYYEDNLELLRELGAEIEFFSPIEYESLPEGTCGVLFGGGYPELHLRELELNTNLKRDLIMGIHNGLPVLAECGGFMYLHEFIEDEQGDRYTMVGAIEGGSIPTGKLGRFGYINLETKVDSVIGKAGTEIKAHEFHYWDSENPGESALAKKPSGKRNWKCVHTKNNMFAGYPHMYYYSNIDVPKEFLNKCLEYKNKVEV
ncbi:MAG: cobyrinate a,c-diamide synthase [Anaerovoracaceae bacterium]